MTRWRMNQRSLRGTIDVYLVWVLILTASVGSIFIGQRWSESLQKQASIQSQRQAIRQAEAKIDLLKHSISELDQSEVAWERLVRERLDYTRPNEIVFEFTSHKDREENQE